MINNVRKNMKSILSLLSIAVLCMQNGQAKRMVIEHETINATSTEAQETPTDTKEGDSPSQPVAVPTISDQALSQDVTSQSKPSRSVKTDEDVSSSYKTNPPEGSSSSLSIAPQGRLITIPRS